MVTENGNNVVKALKLFSRPGVWEDDLGQEVDTPDSDVCSQVGTGEFGSSNTADCLCTVYLPPYMTCYRTH